MIRTFTMYFLSSLAFCSPALLAMEKEDQAIESVYTDLNCMLQRLPRELRDELNKFCINFNNVGTNFWILKNQQYYSFNAVHHRLGVLTWGWPSDYVHQRFNTDLLISDNNTRKVALAYGKSIIVYDLNDHTIQSLDGHTGFITCLAYDSHTNRLFSASGDQTIKVWNLDTSSCIATIEDPNIITTYLAFDEKNNRLFAGSLHRTIKIWNTLDYTFETELSNDSLYGIGFRNNADITGLIYDTQTNCLYSSCSKGMIRIWNFNNGKIFSLMPSKPQDHISAIALDPLTKHLYIAVDSAIKIYDVQTNNHLDPIQYLGQISECGVVGKSLRRIIVDSQRNRLITCSYDSRNIDNNILEIYDIAEKQCIFFRSVSNIIAFDSVNNQLIVDTGNLEVWHLGNSNLIAQLGSLPLEDQIATNEFFNILYRYDIAYLSLDLTQSYNSSLLKAYNKLPGEIQKMLKIYGSLILPGSQRFPLRSRFMQWFTAYLNR